MEVQKFYEFIQRNRICSNINRQIKDFDSKNAQIKEITHVSLAFINQQIPQNNCEILRQGLTQFINLTHFQMIINVGRAYNYEQVIINVSEALKNLNNLQNLNLNIQALINPEVAAKLGQTLSVLKKLQNLDLVFEQNVNICEKGSSELAKGIKCLGNLQHLSLKIK
ncbi:hypothetical protein ABPG72_022152 [Tetrahymena utriculariae]